MIDTWRSWLVQGVSASYLLATIWTVVDDIIKALLGLAMLVLVIFQIRRFARRERRFKQLEKLVAEAAARCPAGSSCPLKTELELLNGDSKDE
jgi:hypothetical protein